MVGAGRSPRRGRLEQMRDAVERYVLEHEGVTVTEVAHQVLRDRGQSGRTRANTLLVALASDGRIHRDTSMQAHRFFAPGADPRRILRRCGEALAAVVEHTEDPPAIMEVLQAVDRLGLREGCTPLADIASARLLRAGSPTTARSDRRAAPPGGRRAAPCTKGEAP